MVGVSQLVCVLCVLGAPLLAQVTAGKPPTCPRGQFAYLVPPIPRLYMHAGEYVCRVCRFCADGQELVRPCEGTNDTQCGGCIRGKEGFVYDEGTHSCQHKDVIAGLARPEDFLTPRGGEKLGGTAAAPVPTTSDRNALSLGLWVSMAVLAVVAIVLLILLLRRRSDNRLPGKEVTTKAVEEQSLSGSDSSSQTASPCLPRRNSEETVPSQVYGPYPPVVNNAPWNGPGQTGGHTCSWTGSRYTQPREGYV
ncbi:Hypp2550 [Branchiostoma lanceolatum]|uniref:Hypp2550 protein n=1 Tax=Branchiostoma lanceolatum TaxID=7740 RepID=A0A8J9ZRW2_BRALA|nr:Hypp2550 [Branchiostoma lanceolatum]